MKTLFLAAFALLSASAQSLPCLQGVQTKGALSIVCVEVSPAKLAQFGLSAAIPPGAEAFTTFEVIVNSADSRVSSVSVDLSYTDAAGKSSTLSYSHATIDTPMGKQAMAIFQLPADLSGIKFNSVAVNATEKIASAQLVEAPKSAPSEFHR